MKVYNKIVIDMSSGITVEEDSYEYEGPVISMKGGSTSGTVDFPQYMKDQHLSWLQQIANDIGELRSRPSPYHYIGAYIPDNDIAAFLADFENYKTAVNAMTPITTYQSDFNIAKSLIDPSPYDDTWTFTRGSGLDVTTTDGCIIDQEVINEAVIAHGNNLRDNMEMNILPRYQTGLRDMNAVISSSYLLGQAILESANAREVAAFGAQLEVRAFDQRNEFIKQRNDINLERSKLNLAYDTLKITNHYQRDQIAANMTKDIIQYTVQKLSFQEAVARNSLENRRITVIMKTEQLAANLDYDEKDYKWKVEAFQYGSNVMSSISGSAVSTQKPSNKMTSVLGGAVSGAAAGAMIGGGYGAIIGGVLGAVGGLLSD